MSSQNGVLRGQACKLMGVASNEKSEKSMGIISSLFGAASEIDAQRLADEFGQILADGEEIEKAYKLVRDLFVFTNRRLILVDRQGVTGKKTQYHSIPYKSISHFSVETTGHFDLDAEITIWISGNQTPFKRQFLKDRNIYDVQKAMATYVLR
jgi:hypothetical protein